MGRYAGSIRRHSRANETAALLYRKARRDSRALSTLNSAVSSSSFGKTMFLNKLFL